MFRGEFRRLAQRPPTPDVEASEDGVDAAPAVANLPVPPWVTGVHLLFIGWTVMNAHYPPLFVGGLSLLPRVSRARRDPYQSPIDLKPPLLVGFFLAGLVIHGGLQGWWIEPTLASLSAERRSTMAPCS